MGLLVFNEFHGNIMNILLDLSKTITNDFLDIIHNTLWCSLKFILESLKSSFKSFDCSFSVVQKPLLDLIVSLLCCFSVNSLFQRLQSTQLKVDLLDQSCFSFWCFIFFVVKEFLSDVFHILRDFGNFVTNDFL